MNYNEKLIEYFKNPQHTGEIKNPSGVGIEGNLNCGDEMKIFIKVENDIIKEIKFKTFGCVAAIASSEALCRVVEGKTVEEALKIEDKDVISHLGDVPAIKHHCSILGVKALRKAIEDYRNKK